MADATADRAAGHSIGELARLTGTTPRRLRHYEATGLLSPARTDGGHRRYRLGTATTVRSIRLLLDAGVPTRLIRELLDCVSDGARVEPCATPVLAAHLADHDRRLAGMLRTRAALQGLIDGAAPAPVRPAATS